MASTRRSRPKPAPHLRETFSRAAVYELWGDGDEATLHPAEAALIGDAIENRRRQFAAGRHCARLAMAELGFEAEPILIGERRSPRWPKGIVGSISHTEGFAVAVVSDGPAPVGIDAERVGRVSEHLYERLFVEAEREWLADLDPRNRARSATSVFGAKEAFYKAQFPVTRAWVGFHDVECRPDGHVLRLHPANQLDALRLLPWPITAHALIVNDVAIATVQLRELSV